MAQLLDHRRQKQEIPQFRRENDDVSNVHALDRPAKDWSRCKAVKWMMISRDK